MGHMKAELVPARGGGVEKGFGAVLPQYWLGDLLEPGGRYLLNAAWSPAQLQPCTWGPTCL